METEIGVDEARIVTVALAERRNTTALCAVTMTGPAGALEGLYRGLSVISFPRMVSPADNSATSHVTDLFQIPVTEAVNCWD